jgi:hypothetical protein
MNQLMCLVYINQIYIENINDNWTDSCNMQTKLIYINDNRRALCVYMCSF